MKSAIALTTSARSAIASAYVAALSTTENTGSLLTQVCEVGARYTKGQPLVKDDVELISADIGRAKGWKGDTLAARISEVRVMLRALHVLPDAIKAYRKESDTCTWHDGMKLARKVNAGKSIKEAVKLVMEGPKGGNTNPIGRLAGAFVACIPKVRGDKREALLDAARALAKAGVIKFSGKNAELITNA
jgi:hypothetical protein